jgi:hypothetical protein
MPGETIKRGSRGGAARALKLTKEERSAIAREASKARWEAVRRKSAEPAAVSEAAPIDLPAPSLDPIPQGPEEKHCPACLAGESLEEGEGTHILATVEHPIQLPAAFQDADASVVVAEPPAAPQKPSKRQTKPMPKELKTASSYAEKRLPQAIKEKADLLVEVARREAEIQELTRVIQALGGQAPVGIPSNGSGQSYPNPAHQPQLPPMYPEYAQPQPVLPVVTPPKPMRAGGAGVAQGMLEVPPHWYDG